MRNFILCFCAFFAINYLTAQSFTLTLVDEHQYKGALWKNEANGETMTTKIERWNATGSIKAARIYHGNHLAYHLERAKLNHILRG